MSLLTTTASRWANGFSTAAGVAATSIARAIGRPQVEHGRVRAEATVASSGDTNGARSSLNNEITADITAESLYKRPPAYPEIPVNYYIGESEAMYSIQHRGFYPNWILVGALLELIREMYD